MGTGRALGTVQRGLPGLLKVLQTSVEAFLDGREVEAVHRYNASVYGLVPSCFPLQKLNGDFLSIAKDGALRPEVKPELAPRLLRPQRVTGVAFVNVEPACRCFFAASYFPRHNGELRADFA